MPSQGVLDRQRVGQELIHAARVHAQSVGERIQLLLAEVREAGEILPDVTQLQILLARLVERRLEDLREADGDHQLELDDDQKPRLRRARARRALHRKIVDLRALYRGLFEPSPASAYLGVSGATAHEPLDLLLQARTILGRLRGRRPALPASRLDGIELDPRKLADEIEPLVDDLSQALDDVACERRKAESTCLRRRRALKAFDRCSRQTGAILRAFAALADLPASARALRRIQPKKQRRAA